MSSPYVTPWICAAKDCQAEAVWSSETLVDGVAILFPVCRAHGSQVARIHGVRSLDWLSKNEGAERD